MREYTKVWTVECYDIGDDEWVQRGIYSTEENAKKAIQKEMKENEDLGYEASDFRIDWSYLDYELED